jgi:gamma-glutamyl-gamma-aminobutyrate hydrolase PuuD
MSFLKVIKDFTVMPGGADINPELYGKKKHRTTSYNNTTDRMQIANYEEAVRKGRPIFGICRGQQLVAAMNGLTLIQDTNHRQDHDVLVKNIENNTFDSSILTNTCHHQMVWTNNELIGDNFEVLGYTSQLSTIFHGEYDNEYAHCIIEPEIMWFPKVKALTVQFHPEWMSKEGKYKDCLEYLEKLINHYY